MQRHKQPHEISIDIQCTDSKPVTVEKLDIPASVEASRAGILIENSTASGFSVSSVSSKASQEQQLAMARKMRAFFQDPSGALYEQQLRSSTPGISVESKPGEVINKTLGGHDGLAKVDNEIVYAGKGMHTTILRADVPREVLSTAIDGLFARRKEAKKAISQPNVNTISSPFLGNNRK